MSITVESFKFANISATTAAFAVQGGEYGWIASATWAGGSITLQVQAADGTTWLTAANAWTANATGLVALPPGWYRVLVSGSTSAGYVSLTGVPT